MKSLNQKQIQRAYNHFLAWFACLLGIIILCVYCFVKNSTHQFNQLRQKKEEFDQVFWMDDVLADKVDSLYNYMSLLNTSRVQNDRQLQRLITKKKEEFTKLVKERQKDQNYFVVYDRLFSHINEMLLLKDSLNKALVEEGDLRDELSGCLRQAVEEHRQQTRKGTSRGF